jgi:signal peptidase I
VSNDNTNTKTTLKEEIGSFLFLIFIALMIRTLVIEPFFIPSTSMKSTLLVGDYLFSTKYSYGYSRYSMIFIQPDFWKGRILATPPKQGDIVIFRPPHAMHTRYIKRLIGLPGDKIQLINNVVYINDKQVKREYVGTFSDEGGSYKQYIETLPNGVKYGILQLVESQDQRIFNRRFANTEIFYVPKDSYFFMGDNRDQSGDSRAELGFVPFENFIAKAQFIFFSTAEFLWLNDGTVLDQIAQVYHWITSIRFDRIFKNLYSVSINTVKQ